MEAEISAASATEKQAAGEPEEALAPEDAPAPEAPAAKESAPTEELDAATLVNERDALSDQLLRARAEFDNYRKRMAREAERTRQLAAEALIRDILPVVDHLELALRHADDHPGALGEGVAMVLRQFQDVLGRHGLEPIAAQGQPFDPTVHEAVMQRESEEAPANVVLEEFQRGYRLGQMVLRPAKVVVSMGAPSGEEVTEAAESESGAQSSTDV